MNTAHIVFTHTRSTSFIKEVVAAAVHALSHAGWSVNTTDLGNWPPIQALSRTAGQESQTDEEFLNVTNCDMLVLVFPVLWCSVPAALKQWIEMVFCDHLLARGQLLMVAAVCKEKQPLWSPYPRRTNAFNGVTAST